MTPTAQLSFPDENEIVRIAALADAAERNRQITDSYSKLSAEVERRIQGHAVRDRRGGPRRRAP